MALLAEVVVEEWLNRQGYFTIRGAKIGVNEIDLLAIRLASHGIECRHLEVQASMRPVSYISKVPRSARREGRPANSAKRSEDELRVGVAEWVAGKFDDPRKRQLMDRLAPGPWSRELVIHRVKSADEVRLIESRGVTIRHLSAIVRELRATDGMIASAGGADFMDLITMADHSSAQANESDALMAAVYRPSISR